MEVDLNAAWNKILHLGNEGVKYFDANTRANTSHAKIIAIWQGMLPICLCVGGFNLCFPDILWLLDAGAVHHIRGESKLQTLQYADLLSCVAREKKKETVLDDVVWSYVNRSCTWSEILQHFFFRW